MVRDKTYGMYIHTYNFPYCRGTLLGMEKRETPETTELVHHRDVGPHDRRSRGLDGV